MAKRLPLTDKDGEVRKLTEDDFKRFKSATDILPRELAEVLPKRGRPAGSGDENIDNRPFRQRRAGRLQGQRQRPAEPDERRPPRLVEGTSAMKSRQRFFCHHNSWSRLGPNVVLFMSLDFTLI